MIKPVLLLDVDGVICDCSSAVHAFAERLLQRPLPKPDVWHAWSHPEAMGLTEEETALFNHCAKGSYFPYAIDFYPGAREAVVGLKTHYDVCFVTAPWKENKHWVHARDRLLDQFGCDVIYTKAKHRVVGDVFLDDNAENVLRGAHARFNILFERSYNKDAQVKHRIKELWELLGYVEKLRSEL